MFYYFSMEVEDWQALCAVVLADSYGHSRTFTDRISRLQTRNASYRQMWAKGGEDKG